MSRNTMIDGKLIVQEAYYMLDHNCTLRDCAKYFGRSKSSIHRDMRDKLLSIDYDLYLEVSSLLKFNLTMRHIRGGLAIKRKHKGAQSC